MAYFPGQQAFRQPYPRKRTMQGGNGRATHDSGVPNLMARGFPMPGRGAGNRISNAPTGQPGPQPAGSQTTPELKPETPGRFMPGGKYDERTPRRWLLNPPARPRDTRVDGRPSTTGQQQMFGGPDSGRPDLTDQQQQESGVGAHGSPHLTRGPGIDPNTLLGRQPVGQHRQPLEHLRFWENWGWRWNGSKFVPVPNGGGGQGGGGGGGHGQPGPNTPPPGGGGGQDQGDGNDPAFDLGPDPMTQDMIANLRRQIGLPLDPQFEAARRMLRDQLMAQLTGAQTQYGVGQADIAHQGVIGNQAIDEDMAARGLFGSGIENRNERMLGDNLALQSAGLLGNYSTSQQGAQMDFRRGMIEALLDLARRSSRDPRAPMLRG